MGSLTTELIRKELLKQGLNVSNRDVFIEGISNEFDLLILKPDSKPKDGFLVFEDKYKKILKILLNSENDKVKQKSVELINYLLKMNLHSFKDLLIEIP